MHFLLSVLSVQQHRILWIYEFLIGQVSTFSGARCCIKRIDYKILLNSSRMCQKYKIRISTTANQPVQKQREGTKCKKASVSDTQEIFIKQLLILLHPAMGSFVWIIKILLATNVTYQMNTMLPSKIYLIIYFIKKLRFQRILWVIS